MRRFVIYSVSLHGLLVAVLVTLGTLLAQPRMSYYSVDLLSSLPSGPMAETVAKTVSPPAPAAPVVKQAPPPKPVVKPATRESIKVATKHPLPVRPTPAAKRPTAVPSWAVADNPTAEATSSEPQQASRSGAAAVSAVTGQPFPFPWYLKTVSERLQKAWRPPEEFAAGTSCQVSFRITRSGQIAEPKITKASGDPFYDQLALRAVEYANPLPPLPNGFPEPSLRVHMTFDGRLR